MQRFFLVIVLILLSFSAHALPSNSFPNNSEDLDNSLKDRSLRGQFELVRQTMGEKASDLVVNAMSFLGAPYRRGGTDAQTGFDCSGFVRAMYEQTVGKLLPRRADQQAAATELIDRSELKPGDLVFFNTMRRAFSHVGIYIGDNKFIHSPKPGSQVRVEDMRQAYWEHRFTGARRVPDAGEQPSSQR